MSATTGEKQSNAIGEMKAAGAPRKAAKKNRSGKSKKAAQAADAPNVQFVGRRKLSGGKYEQLEAPAFVNTGQRRIDLPASDEQKAGFYLPPKDARAVRAEYPFWYKAPKVKGKSK